MRLKLARAAPSSGARRGLKLLLVHAAYTMMAGPSTTRYDACTRSRWSQRGTAKSSSSPTIRLVRLALVQRHRYVGVDEERFSMVSDLACRLHGALLMTS